MDKSITDPELTIGHATLNELEGIMKLLSENQPERGGTLSANFTRSYVVSLILNRSLIVACRAGEVVGFLMSSDKEANNTVPIINAMLSAYSGSPDAYVYGPICVKSSERGRGIAQAMFDELKSCEKGREGILFIRSDNQPSMRAHLKMGMQIVASFVFENTEYQVLSYFAKGMYINKL